MRKPLIAGNWKMYKTIPEAVNLVNSIKAGVHVVRDVDIVLCPTFTVLNSVIGLLEGTSIELGAQNMFPETEGAYTGEISPLMIKDIGCRYVILGHSERRKYIKETDEFINKKVKLALKFSLIPIVCIGETLEERDRGEANEVVRRQFNGSLADLSKEEIEKVVIAYEPVWAIGTGRTATPQQAEDMQGFIRGLVKEKYGENVSSHIRILYGGSVKPDNIANLIKQENIDGALVGGASLKAESFIEIVSQSQLKEEGQGVEN